MTLATNDSVRPRGSIQVHGADYDSERRFVVGFSLLNPTGAFPAAMDTSSASRQRSYVSGNGTAFSLVDSTLIGPGNLVIRAKVDVPASAAPVP